MKCNCNYVIIFDCLRDESMVRITGQTHIILKNIASFNMYLFVNRILQGKNKNIFFHDIF